MKDANHLKRGNLLWESSRMFLPEHKEQLLEHRRRERQFVMPEFTEDRLSELNDALEAAWRSRRPAVIIHAGLYGAERFTGRITRIDPLSRIIRIEGKSDHLLLPLDQLLGVELVDSDSNSDSDSDPDT